jgi:uncharacterized damage-inducible protein DinB
MRMLTQLFAMTFVTGALWAQSSGPLMQSILPKFESARMNLVESAEAMPEGDYAFKLTPAQRAFGDWIDHNISMNYSFCSRMEGKPMPKEKLPTAKDKATLVQALKDSFGYCETVFKSFDDSKALTPVQMGTRTTSPADGMISLLTQWNEHYGNMVGYMRSKGVTPPSTARSQKKQ